MDITAISSALLAQAQPLPAAPVARAEPNALAAERFNAIMNAPVAPLPDAQALAGVQPALAAAVPASTAPTLGGQILSGLRGAAAEVSGKWQGIANSLDALGAQPAISDMLRVQTQLLQVSVQYELVGKAVSRSTQNIDTLVRMS